MKSAPSLGEGREEAAMKFSTDAKMKTLLQSPEAVAVLERYCPKILKNPVLQMTSSMTLRTVAAFAQSGLKPELLVQIDEALRAIPEQTE